MNEIDYTIYDLKNKKLIIHPYTNDYVRKVADIENKSYSEMFNELRNKIGTLSYCVSTITKKISLTDYKKINEEEYEVFDTYEEAITFYNK